jgi:hypothetical protein
MTNRLIHPLVPTRAEILAIQESVKEKLNLKVHLKSAGLLATALMLLREYQQYGKLTVRQLYYLLVTRGAMENSKASYQRYVNHLTTGRRSGVIPWDAFEDRSRMFYQEPSPRYDINREDDPKEALTSWFQYALRHRLSEEYDLRLWEGQPCYLEVWVEKDALAGFLSPLCENLGVGVVVSRGYTSFTFKQEARERFLKASKEGRRAILLYLGDLDPSGYDIYRCLREELKFMSVERLGLNEEDVQEYGLIPCKIKEKDTRANGFRKMFPHLEDNVYELDALPPGELISRSKDAILKYFDKAIADENKRLVRHWRAGFTDHQDKIKDLLKGSGIEIE